MDVGCAVGVFVCGIGVCVGCLCAVGCVCAGCVVCTCVSRVCTGTHASKRGRSSSFIGRGESKSVESSIDSRN